MTSLPRLGGQAKLGKGSSPAWWRGGVKAGLLRISGFRAGALGNLGEMVLQVNLLDIANKNTGRPVKSEFQIKNNFLV